ncbi:MAG: AAA family ATPase [Capsulimonadales bacterium]|nr:AAA family ATPase [Capsulimonadales bacterium]
MEKADELSREDAAGGRVVPPSPILVHLLGELRLCIGGETITGFRSRKARALLAYLAFFRERRHSREMLAERFWPEAVSSKSRTSLNTELYALRNQLERPGTPPNTILICDTVSVGLNPDLVTTDIKRFADRLAQAERLGNDERAIPVLRSALALANEEFLPGSYEEWALHERERHRERFVTSALRLARLLKEFGNKEEEAHWLKEVVRIDPTHSEAVTHLFRHLLDERRETEAVAIYRELRDRLQSTWNMEPPPEVRTTMAPLLAVYTAPARRTRSSGPGRTAALATAAIADMAVAGRQDAPEDRTVPTRRVKTDTAPELLNEAPGRENWLPAPLTRFYGRENELTRLRWMLGDPNHRLITLTGPGGIGKTRLALSLARRLREPAGISEGMSEGMRVLFVSVADARTIPALLECVKQGFGIHTKKTADAMTAIVDFLRTEPTLLILDNFEQLIGVGAERWVEELLQRVPALTCLVTSRIRLPLQGESEFPVLPLEVPEEPDEPQDTETVLRDYPAVALFVDRAQQAVPYFPVNRKTVTAIIRLVRYLEGIPLAIELAAARARVYPPAQMLEQMTSRFRVLVSHRPMFEERHRSLRATIEWSFRLLTEEQRAFFLRLAVLRGAWITEDAEAVTGVPDPAEFLADLADASLVRTEFGADRIRFRMLETIRDFALEKLEESLNRDERERLYDRHVARFVSVAEELLKARDGNDQATWREEIRRSHENCCAALERCLETPGLPALESSVRIVASLSRFWRLEGWHRPGIVYLERIRERSEWPELSVRMRSSLLNGIGMLKMETGQTDEAEPFFHEARELLLAAGDENGAFAALHNLAILAGLRGRGAETYHWLEECLAYWRRVNDPQKISLTLTNLACESAELGDTERARTLLEESCHIARTVGQVLPESNALVCLGFLMFERGDRNAAEQRLRDSLRLQSQLRNWKEAALILLALSEMIDPDGDNLTEGGMARTASDYLASVDTHPGDFVPFRNGVLSRRIAALVPGTAGPVARAEERLRQAVVWALEETPIFR